MTAAEVDTDGVPAGTRVAAERCPEPKCGAKCDLCSGQRIVPSFIARMFRWGQAQGGTER
jgi:hypothetical protein